MSGELRRSHIQHRLRLALIDDRLTDHRVLTNVQSHKSTLSDFSVTASGDAININNNVILPDGKELTIVDGSKNGSLLGLGLATGVLPVPAPPGLGMPARDRLWRLLCSSTCWLPLWCTRSAGAL